jgi:hypothetical protein
VPVSRVAAKGSQLEFRAKGQVDSDGSPQQRGTIERYARTAGFEQASEYRDENLNATKDLGVKVIAADFGHRADASADDPTRTLIRQTARRRGAV